MNALDKTASIPKKCWRVNGGSMDNFTTGLHSQAEAGAKTSLTACLTESNIKTSLMKLEHFWG
jgi:hypothetical protein